jgi:predicted Zn-dependent protease
MRKFFELLKTKGAIAFFGLLIGLFGGFRAANARYRAQQETARDKAATQAMPAGRNAGDANAMQQETSRVLEAARANPNDFEAQMAAADQFLQIQRPDGALPFLTQANKLKPEDTRPMSGLATVALMHGQHAEAVRWARASLQRKPADLGAKVLLMFALIEARQQLNEAEQLLNDLEKARPNDGILGDARRALAEARSGSAPVSQPSSGNKSTLDHGPATDKSSVK